MGTAGKGAQPGRVCLSVLSLPRPSNRSNRAGFPGRATAGGTAAGFSSPLIHSLIHWLLEAAHTDARRKGRARRTAAAGCGPAPEGRPVGGRLARPRGARACARAGGRRGARPPVPEVRVAAPGCARPGASRSALGPHGPQPRPVCRGRTRGLCDPRRGALRPPRPVPADARSVSRSVSHRARAAGAAGALSVRERSVAPGEAAAAAGRRNQLLPSAGLREGRGAAAVSAPPPGPRGRGKESSGRPGGAAVSIFPAPGVALQASAGGCSPGRGRCWPGSRRWAEPGQAACGG